MTKIEKDKFEKMCIEAINYIEMSKKLFQEHREIDKEYHVATQQLRNSDFYRGCAEGIFQTLLAIKYSSEKMKELTDYYLK